ncbi:biosynthetic peptidoglycan transglycosylase [Flavobacterium sp.]|uniref:transglycosylase domain-containing protein n=1 Tax=Flavobacterium sp. TaxID=239 RepID=UPI0025BF07CC|nr:biosynthetic peptidoglycan transglycosylase [Flavobacterium sp.]
MKKKIKIFSLLLLLLFSISLVFGYLFRNEILHYALGKIQKKLETKYNCMLTFSKAELLGLSGVELQNIYLIPKQADTLLAVQAIKTKINPFGIILGTIQIKNLEMHHGYIQLVKNEKGRNFDNFLKKDTLSSGSSQNNYAKKAYQLITKLLNLVPTDMHLNNLALKINDNGKKIVFTMQELKLTDKKLKSKIEVKEDLLKQKWNLEGTADPREMNANLRFHSVDKSNIVVPYLASRLGLQSHFKSIQLEIKNIDFSNSEMHFEGKASITNLTLNHPKIACKDVSIENAAFNYNFLIGEKYIALDSTSSILLNKLKIQPFASYSTEKDTIYKLRIKIPETQAQNFISSLPKGLFRHFEGMEAIGSFNYALYLEYNKNQPEALVFDSQFHKNKLQIIKYGEADLEKLNREFTYRAVENGILQRPILIGASNPFFTAYENLPILLKNAVLTSEDPSFMKHRGFITEAFKQSIIKNIRTKKFARGASTISMQLVKNVFLTREKTLSRKLEEIVLVYILENNRIASKERMLEVYFNIIEWGPNVYGIGEAASFYFQKRPQELNLNECLFLASIVPKPKKFMWQFDINGNQKEYVVKNQNFIKNIMLKRGLLTEMDTINQHLPIQIKGMARSFLKIKPTEKDTLQEIDDIEF